MATKPQAEKLAIDGREVSITNPGKVLFPDAGHTKMDLVRYYLAVAEGALRGAGGRPNAPRNWCHATGPPSLLRKAMARKPSHLGSKRKPPAVGISATSLASIGSMGGLTTYQS